MTLWCGHPAHSFFFHSDQGFEIPICGFVSSQATIDFETGEDAIIFSNLTTCSVPLSVTVQGLILAEVCAAGYPRSTYFCAF